MVFSSLFFVFAFLPITVIAYHVLRKSMQNIVLLTASLFFYAWGEPVYVLLMCISIAINYCIGIVLSNEGTAGFKRKLFFIICMAFNFGFLAYFKYFGMIINALLFVSEGLGRTGSSMEAFAIPLGISFYTFQAQAYIIDVYRKRIQVQKSLLLFALYIAMFPQLVAGPIVGYADIEKQLRYRNVNLQKFILGLQRFLRGLAKKVLLANNIGILWAEIKLMSDTEISMLMAWAGIIAFALQVYFDFSGYSDMAIGLGKMFGFDLKENFNYPYISQSVSEFWRRWHISLGRWFREYLYIPLGGSRCGKLRLITSLLIVWLFTGLWHGASLNFIFWGIYFGIIIIIEKLFLQKIEHKLPRIIRHIYLLLSVVIGWVFFEFQSLSDISSFLGYMFGASRSIVDAHAVEMLKPYAIFYIVCIFAALPSWSLLAQSFTEKYKLNHIYNWLITIYHSALLFFSTAYMLGSTYSPFVYFRF